MKNTILITLMVTGLVTGKILPSSAQLITQAGSPELKIYCGQAKDPSSKSNVPATLAQVAGKEEPTALILWKSEFFGSKFTPQKRCEEVSPKFQAAFQAERTFLTVGLDKRTGQGILCGVANQDEVCDRSQMIFTLKSYQNAAETIEKLANLVGGKTNVPIYQSSNGKYIVNLRDLLNKK
jgi:Circadian oscillating protein COP23